MRGTTTSTANKFMMKSRASRPATGGNKNIAMGAKRQGNPNARVAGTIGGSLKGPFLGRRS